MGFSKSLKSFVHGFIRKLIKAVLIIIFIQAQYVKPFEAFLRLQCMVSLASSYVIERVKRSVEVGRSKEITPAYKVFAYPAS